jgi:hypothetical protein
VPWIGFLDPFFGVGDCAQDKGVSFDFFEGDSVFGVFDEEAFEEVEDFFVDILFFEFGGWDGDYFSANHVEELEFSACFGEGSSSEEQTMKSYPQCPNVDGLGDGRSFFLWGGRRLADFGGKEGW